MPPVSHAASQPVVLAMQRQGFHDFFEQDSQQQQFVAGNWPWTDNNGSKESAQLFYCGTYGAEEKNWRDFLLKGDSYKGNGSDMPHTGGSCLQSFVHTGGDSANKTGSSQIILGLRQPQDAAKSPVIKTQPGNQQQPNVNGPSNHFQNSQLNPSPHIPFGNGDVSHHSNSNNEGFLGDPVQNPCVRFLGENSEAGSLMEAQGFGLLQSHILPKEQGQGTIGQQIGNTGRPAELSDLQFSEQSLQLQRQLYEVQQQLIAQQLWQLSENPIPQQVQQQILPHFPGNSYSALLYGPDLPPSQPQPQRQPQPVRSSGGVSLAGLESCNPTFLPANFANTNTGGRGWPLNGSSDQQWFKTDLLTGHDSHLLPSKRPPLTVGNISGSMVAFYPGQQSKLTEHSYGSLGLLSNVQIGKTISQPSARGNAHFSEQIRFLNLGNVENSNSEERQQAYLKPILGQNSGHSDEQLMNQNLMANDLLQINVLSKGQNQFQDFQVNLRKNWDGFEQKQDAPSNGFSQTLEVVPQSIIKAQEGCLQNGADQQRNSLDTRNGTAVAGQFLDRSSSLTGNSKPHSISDFNQQQCWNAPLSGSSFDHVYDGNVGERFGAWQTLQGPSTLFDSGNNLQSLANAKPNICRPDSSKPTYFWSGNVFRPVEPFHRQHIEFLNVPSLPQSISKDDRESPGTLADSIFQPYLKNSCSAEDPKTRQGSGWKESQRTTDTACMLNPSLEWDVHLESSWKILSPPSELPAVLETMDQPLDQDGLNTSRIQDAHQGNIETEAPYRMKLTPRKTNLVNRHEIQQSHQPCEEVFSGRDIRHHQNENLDPEGSHHTFQFGSKLGEQNSKLVPNGRKDAGTPFDEKRVEPEADGGAHVDSAGPQNIVPPNNLFIMEKNSSVGKEIKISEPTDTSPSGISLAHLRPSQSSSPLSPHNIRLGLGPPSQSSQISRQVLDGNLAGHNVCSHPGYGVCDHQLVEGESTFLSREGGRSIEAYERALQNSSRLISVQNTSIPSFVSNDSIHSKSLPPSIFAPGQEFLIASRENACIGAHELLISFENSKGAGQQEANAEKTFLSTSVQSNANMMSYRESQGRSSAEFTTQSSFTPDHSTQLSFVSNSSHGLLDWHKSNLAFQQVGERTQGTDFSGLLTTSKISLSEQSNCLVDNEAFGAFGHASGGVALIESVQVPQETEMMRKSTDTQILCTEGLSSVPRSSTGSQNCADEHKVLSEPLQEKTFSDLEANGLATHTVEQERRSPFPVQVSCLNGSGFSLQAQRPGHGQDQPERIDRFSPLLGSIAVLPQSGRQSRMYNSLERDTVSPAFLVKGKSVQHQIDKGIESLSFSQMSEGLPLSGGKGVFCSESRTVPGGKLSEATRKPSKTKGKPEILGANKANLKGSIEELAPHAFHRSGQNAAVLEFRSMSHQNFSCAEGLFQRELQVQDSLWIEPGQLPDQAQDNLALNASSRLWVGKGQNAEAMCSSVPYLGNNCSKHLPTPAHVHRDLSDGCEVSASSQQFLDKKPGQAVPYIAPPCTPDGLTDLESKEVDSRSFSRDTSLPIDEISQHPLCPLTTEYHTPVTVCPKKRKKLSPPLIPWHMAAIQPHGELLSTREAELLWANGINRLPEKDAGELYDGGMSSVIKAKRRLRLTTQLMQQIIPPLSGALMHGNRAVDNACATYNLSKLSLGDACRLVADTSREVKSVQNDLDYKAIVFHGKSRHWNVARRVAITRIVEHFTDKLMQLDCELSRLDHSTSALELKGELQGSEKVSIVNRLARQHVIGFSLDSSRHCIESSSEFSTGIRRPAPQKYVTAGPMPRTLPYVRCLSL